MKEHRLPCLPLPMPRPTTTLIRMAVAILTRNGLGLAVREILGRGRVFEAASAA